METEALVEVQWFQRHQHIILMTQCKTGIITIIEPFPDSKVYGAIMGPIWGQQEPGGLYDGPMNFAIWVDMKAFLRIYHR